MRSLLDALQDGRLIELPENNKTKVLEYLATLIEAIPDIGVEGGITESILAREQSYSTGIGKGWACPHARSTVDGQLLCAVGWSPGGIDYGAADGEKIHIVVMYYVPDTQKNAYLKEISSLAKAIQTQPALQDLKSLDDLADARHRLLDAISAAAECAAPEARARMIQLEARHTELQKSAAVSADFANRVIPLTLIVAPDMKPLTLCQDRALADLLENQDSALAADLVKHGQYERPGIRVLLRSTTHYQLDRVLHDCLAIKLEPARR
ncbi:MAG: PTS sugar transporter subunit IIA [Verrucomicrobiales bacterium]|jgi:mannitol/fructose-specific phosphotransferase system IIA component (Ntr-type)|nr:PTS sugar transporter subunit IIA [Verrucomicrobiales bacterium]